VIAADVERDTDFLVATDARRREVFWARYGQAGRQDGPHVSVPAAIPSPELPVAGEGPLLYSELLPNAHGPAYPAAATLCRMVVTALAAGGDGAAVLMAPEPLYLRRPDVREPGTPKRVSQ
jgi:tRNA A37 threonylcarbamoyladenosine modification protein TsaB